MQQTLQGNDRRDIDFMWLSARFGRPMSRDSGEDRARSDVVGLGQCVHPLAISDAFLLRCRPRGV